MINLKKRWVCSGTFANRKVLHTLFNLSCRRAVVPVRSMSRYKCAHDKGTGRHSLKPRMNGLLCLGEQYSRAHIPTFSAVTQRGSQPWNSNSTEWVLHGSYLAGAFSKALVLLSVSSRCSLVFGSPGLSAPVRAC